MKTVLNLFRLTVLLLVGLGAVVLCSVAMAMTKAPPAESTSWLSVFGANYLPGFFRQYLVWILLGVAVFWVCSVVPYQVWRKYFPMTVLLIVVALVLLALTITPGFRTLRNGSYRWLKFSGFSFQPSELVKMLLVIGMAVYYEKIGSATLRFVPGMLVPGVLLGVTVGLLLGEPDFGSIVVIGLIVSSIMFIAGARLKHMFLVGVPMLVLVAVCLLCNDNRMKRMREHREGTSYQETQSLEAFRRAGIRGVGLFNGIQKHYTPEAHTDFIFVTGVEEAGLAFSLGVLLLFGSYAFCGWRFAEKAPDRTGKLIAYGFTFSVTLQALLNFVVVSALGPTKGLALPFFSYGGTNLVMAMASSGILVNIGKAGILAELEERRSGVRDGLSSF